MAATKRMFREVEDDPAGNAEPSHLPSAFALGIDQENRRPPLAAAASVNGKQERQQKKTTMA